MVAATVVEDASFTDRRRIMAFINYGRRQVES